MKKSKVFLALIVAGLLLCSTTALARISAEWTYEKLFKESDLIVFATAIKTEAADDKWLLPRSVWPYELAAQNTTFKVEYALKGKIEGDQIEVLHFKFGELKKGEERNNIVVIDGPEFVAFRTKPVTVTVDRIPTILPRPKYMLFLRKGQDERYEPVSGRIDPAFSVKEVYEASGDLLQGRGDPK